MNYHSLILAGMGNVGKGICRLGEDVFQRFERVVLLDRDADAFAEVSSDCKRYARIGDVTHLTFLNRLLAELHEPILFVDVCSGIDSVRLRRFLSHFEVGYIGCGASCGVDAQRSRYSRIMPYTNQATHRQFPHLINQGINPGVVELMARKLMREFGDGESFEVLILERDSLRAALPGGTVAVGWSPADVVEEFMVSPTLEVVDGRIREDETAATRRTLVCREHEAAPARVVGHEDIFNLGMLDCVQEARFCYSLHVAAMSLFDTVPEYARSMLEVPSPQNPIFGTDSIVVKVTGRKSGESKALQWQVDHHEIWKQYGLNGVQYQTGRSLLASIQLMQDTDLGRCPATYHSSNLPLTGADWSTVHRVLEDLQIDFKPISPETVLVSRQRVEPQIPIEEKAPRPMRHISEFRKT